MSRTGPTRTLLALAAVLALSACETPEEPAGRIGDGLTPLPTSQSALVPDAPVGYRSCQEARDHGAAPLHEGDAGWTPQLDKDGDGVACE